MEEISQILLLIIVLMICWYYFCNWRKSINLPPGPMGLPILGYLPFLNQKSPYKTLQQLSLKYGPIYGLNLGAIYTVILTDVAIIRDALRRDEFTARAPLYITHGIMGGYGLICAEGPLWKDQRRQSIDWLKRLGMTKFGGSRIILEKRIQTGVIEFLNTLVSENSTEFKPMNAALHHSLGNILNDLVFGIQYKTDDLDWKYLQELQENGVKLIGISGVVNFLPILRFLPSNQRIIKYLLNGKTKTHQIYNRIIENCQFTLNVIDNTENISILKLFLMERQERIRNSDPNIQFMTDEQLRHLLADLYGAGVDTTLTTLRWFILYMAKYQNYQQLIRQKLSQIQHGSDEMLNLIDLESIDFLKACISETQRIRSVVPLGIPHGTLKETILSTYKIPKNTMIIPLQWAIHMNPNIWPDPEIFNPYHFLNDCDEYYVPSNFIPFQTGKRMCLGDDFAKMMLISFAGNLICQYEIKLISDEADINWTGDCGITLTPPQNYQLNFHKIIK